MTGKSHLTIGVVTYASIWLQPLPFFHAPLLGNLSSPAVLPVALFLVAIGSLLPDLDHPDGRLANERLLGLPLLKPLAWLIHAIFGHRGATHSLLALAGIILAGELPFLPWAPLHLGFLLGWGYALHLVADGLTKSGVPLLWPLEYRAGFPPSRRLRFTTGTWREGVVVFFLILACSANVLERFWRQ